MAVDEDVDAVGVPSGEVCDRPSGVSVPMALADCVDSILRCRNNTNKID